MILILDIDGTLADASHREHFAEDEDWDSFFELEAVAEDEPIEEAQQALPDLMDLGYEVLFITGRPERTRDVTVQWLETHFDVSPSKDELYMRPDGDTSHGSDYKRNIVEGLDDEDMIIIDDDPYILSMFSPEFGMALRAPEAWDVLLNEVPDDME